MTVNQALNEASFDNFDSDFGNTDLHTGFTANWTGVGTGPGSTMVVYGNGDIHLRQQGGIWHLDEGYGSTAYDSSPCHNDGTVYGATWTDGIVGKALSFDGVNDYVKVPHDTSLSTDQITYECWIKLPNQPSSGIHYHILVSKHGGYKGGLYADVVVGSEDFRLSFMLTIGGTAYYLHYNWSPDNQWHHLVGTYDGEVMRLYLDGEEKASRSDPSGAIASNTQPVRIMGGVTNRYTIGRIDEVRIYDRALSPGEIAQHAVDYSAVAVYHLNEGSRTTAFDSSPYPNTGTIDGASWTYGVAVNGVLGKALSFDGVNDYMKVPHSDSISGLSKVTLMLWVKLRSVPPAHSVNLGGICPEYWLEYRTTQYLSLSTYINGVYDGQGFTVNLADGKWHMLTMTYDGTYKRGYLDGQPKATYSIPGTLDNSDNPFYLGAGFSASQAYNGCPDGIIDEVRIYDGALSPEEIADHYAAVTPYYSVTVRARNQYGYSLPAPLFIDGQYVGTTPYTCTVSQGNHQIEVYSSFMTYPYVYHVFQYYYYDGTYNDNNPMTLSVTSDKTVTAYYYSYYY